MTDSEKLDLLLSEMQDMKQNITEVKQDISNMKLELIEVK